MRPRIEWGVKLELATGAYFRVKRGQTIAEIARVFHTTPRLIAAENGLSAPPQAGQVLKIPERTGDLYVVRGGESKTLLCGSPEAFARKNASEALYIGQCVVL